MKKLFMITILSTLLFSLNAQTAGDHLIKFQKKKNASLVIAGISTLFALLPLSGMVDKDQAMPIYVIAGTGLVISFSLNISAIQQVGKAGRKLNAL